MTGELQNQLEATLEMIEEQIAQVEMYARDHGVRAVQMQDANGGFLLIPLLAAKAQLLSVMKPSKDVVFNQTVSPPSPEVLARAFQDTLDADRNHIVNMDTVAQVSSLTGLKQETLIDMFSLGWLWEVPDVGALNYHFWKARHVQVGL